VGLVTAAGLASVGRVVTCADLRADVVARIDRADPPIHEDGLPELLASVRSVSRLRATTDVGVAVRDADVTMICVGTPSKPEGADLSQLLSAARAVGNALGPSGPWHLVIVKSTVPPGTTEGPVLAALEVASGRTVGEGFGLAMCPEFLREGRAVRDFLEPDRIVIGAVDARSRDAALRLWEPFPCPRVLVSPRAAEMIKYASNAFLATAISFSNEVANLCSALPDLDAREVFRGVHLDRRLGPGAGGTGRVELTDYLWHGLGFGGSCFPKDVAALAAFGRALRVATPLLDAVLTVNTAQPERLVEALASVLDPRGLRVAVFGLAFKPGTDDVRESPAFPLIVSLRRRGASVVAHDPVAARQAALRPEMDGVEMASSWQEALDGADACCLVTRWPEYLAIPPGEFTRRMRTPLVVDGRGAYDPAVFASAGVLWRGIGLSPSRALSPERSPEGGLP
jgi:UDPglucose 6-dehydrogenase/GDP-mannose 6-dehydrogenase